MGKMVEIRWHGRGGQGAKTASLLLAEAAFDTGKFIQGFPEYGPERMGAPIELIKRNINMTPKGGVSTPSIKTPINANACAINDALKSPRKLSMPITNAHNNPGSSRGNSINPL
jgi:pyruvate ferredoxin oxidoreductase gamma subunit